MARSGFPGCSFDCRRVDWRGRDPGTRRPVPPWRRRKRRGDTRSIHGATNRLRAATTGTSRPGDGEGPFAAFRCPGTLNTFMDIQRACAEPRVQRNRDTSGRPTGGWLMARFDERFIDEVRARTGLADLVGRYVTLKKDGRKHKGLCPFHAGEDAQLHGGGREGIFPLLRLLRPRRRHRLSATDREPGVPGRRGTAGPGRRAGAARGREAAQEEHRAAGRGRTEAARGRTRGARGTGGAGGNAAARERAAQGLGAMAGGGADLRGLTRRCVPARGAGAGPGALSSVVHAAYAPGHGILDAG